MRRRRHPRLSPELLEDVRRTQRLNRDEIVRKSVTPWWDRPIPKPLPTLCPIHQREMYVAVLTGEAACPDQDCIYFHGGYWPDALPLCRVDGRPCPPDGGLRRYCSDCPLRPSEEGAEAGEPHSEAPTSTRAGGREHG